MTASRTEPSSRTAAVVLAAGLGTRMRSRTPKILHPLCGRPMLAYVLDAWDEALVELDGTDRAAAPPVVVYSPMTEAIRDVVGNVVERGPNGIAGSPRNLLEGHPAAIADKLADRLGRR